MYRQNVVGKVCPRFVPDCVRSNLRGPKFKVFLVGGGGGHNPSRYTRLSTCEHAFACY